MKSNLQRSILTGGIMLLATSLGAQTDEQQLLYKSGNPADWPMEQDAVTSAPGNHKILLENEQVRVLEVTVAPKEIEPVHHHQWPSVLYVMEAGNFIDRDAEGNVIMDTRELPQALQFPLTMYKEPEAPHSVENLSGSQPIHLIRVEMKSGTTRQLKPITNNNPTNMKTEANVQTINSLYKAFSENDIPTVMGLMHPKIEWNEAESNSLADGNPYVGPNAILEGVFARLGANHEYFGLQDVELHGMENNKVLATLRYDAKVKETGKKYNAQAAHLWTLNDEGKIIAFQQFVDTKKLAEAEEH